MRKTVGQARLELINRGVFDTEYLHYVLYNGENYIATIVTDPDQRQDSHVIAKAVLNEYKCEYLWVFDCDANFISCYDSEGVIVELDFDNYALHNYSQADTIRESFNKDFTLEEVSRLYRQNGPKTLSPALSNGEIVGLERMCD